MSLIKEVYDGKAPLQDAELDKLADQVADKTSGKTESGRSTPSPAPAEKAEPTAAS